MKFLLCPDQRKLQHEWARSDPPQYPAQEHLNSHKHAEITRLSRAPRLRRLINECLFTGAFVPSVPHTALSVSGSGQLSFL
ncbi:hypothetical protein MHYP_G00046420 [Metynnis hypsauchen]